MTFGNALLRVVAVSSLALSMSACGPMSPDEVQPSDDLVESKSNLGICPGYDACTAWSGWADSGGGTTCNISSSCGYTWVCEEDPWGCPNGIAPTPQVDEKGLPIPPCCGTLYREPNPATFSQQQRYRICFNAAGASCTDIENQYAVNHCGC